ncbi:MAG: polyprenyl synthetase family protein [Chloroflexota bacterium]|nr:polyprenyl synthetase family protein [Chloroflexota bacterium]
MLLSKIYEPVQEDLVKVEDSLKSVRQVDFPWLSEMVDYSLSGGGKRIRPALTLLAGKFYDYNLESLLPMAVAVELMHTATLVHDDAIDNSLVRRGKPTVNSVCGDDKAVLLGDYLFARAGEFATDTKNLPVVKLFTQTLATISSGELSQILSAFKLGQSRQDYLRRIAGKTASLFALATESGAILSHAPEKAIRVLRDYGYNLGIAFQIVDDILDFAGTEADLGKPVGSDLAQGTLTLPAMLLLERYPHDNPVDKLFRGEEREKNIARALAMVGNSTIVEECSRIVSEYCTRASQSLCDLPDNATRQSLTQMAEYFAVRKK